LIVILLPPASIRVVVTFAVVILALAVTGVVSAKLGSAAVGRAVTQLVGGGAAAMVVTYGIGQLVGANVT
jgi:VIT1/CCC1 family predicted Fe2+/Mn2+ transporter